MNARMTRLAVSLTVLASLPLTSEAAPPEVPGKLDLVVQTGHSGSVNCVALSGDGKRLVTGSNDSTAILWDAETGEKLRTFQGAIDTDIFDGGVGRVQLSNDGKRLYTAARNKPILWNAETGEVIHDFQKIGLAHLSNDCRRLVSLGNQEAILWNAETGAEIRSIKMRYNPTNPEIASLHLSGDGKRLVTGGTEMTAALWNVETGEQIRILKAGDFGRMSYVQFSNDGKRLVTDSQFGDAIMWNAQTGEKLRTFRESPKSARVRNAHLSGDGKRLVTTSEIGDPILWNTETGEKLRTFKKPEVVEFLWLSDDGKRLVAGGSNGANLWNADTGEVLRRFKMRYNGVTSVHLNDDGKRLVTGSNDRTATVWNTQTGEKPRTFQGTDRVNSVWLSGDGKSLVTGCKTAILWNAETGEQTRTFKAFIKDSSCQVTSVQLSGDGKRLATASSRTLAELWNVATGEKIREFTATPTGFGEALLSMNLAYDGKRLVTGSMNKTAIWNADTGKEIAAFKADRFGIHPWALSGDGKRLVTQGAGRGYLELWNAETGEKLHKFKDIVNVSSACLSFGGKYLVTGSWDTTAVLWNPATGEKYRTFRGHTSNIESVWLSSDSKRLVTGSRDGTCRVWDTDTERELGALVSFDGGKDWLVFTPDGYFDGSENGARFVSFRVAGTNELVPLDRYRRQFERPGLLAKIWAGEDYRGTKAVKQDLPPKVRITTPAANFESKDGKLLVEAEAVSQGEYPVTQFRLLVNGRPHAVNFGLVDVAAPKTGKATAKWEIALEPGNHTIEAVAHTRAVFGKSASVEVRHVGGGPAPGFQLPTLYILAVGVSKYPKQPLDYAHRDAEEVAKAFRTHSKPLFKNIETKVLTDEKATRAELLEGLGWLRKNMTQKDFGVFFFAGHGVRDMRGKVYFLPVDGDREKLTSTAIDGNVMADELTSTVGQLLVILDACHAGAVGDGKTRGLSDELLKDLSSEEKGIAIMCSASGREEAGESREHQHGKFTVALLEGLKGAGDGKETKIRLNDGAVYFKQLDGYVTDRVKTLSKGEQHPVTCIPRNFRDFPLSKP